MKTPYTAEMENINLAVELAKSQLKDGTASSQVITHYLKLANTERQLELENKELQNKLLEAKCDFITSQKEEGFGIEAVLDALKGYRTDEEVE